MSLENLGEVSGKTTITIDGNCLIDGDVYGGGNESAVGGDVEVNLQGGIVSQDVYGGGALANTNTSANKTTTVILKNGTVTGDVYGGAKGDETTAPLVGGNVLVKLNEAIATDNCVVQGRIFGCNNVNGTPKGTVTVHVFKTQGWAGHDVSEGKADDSIEKTNTVYELAAVYGGGNQAVYEPTDLVNGKTSVIIEGCDQTSIEYVYGGANAASVPATDVVVNGCYEIGSCFGGGNGRDPLSDGSPNPGANVGYKTIEFTPDDSKTDEENAEALAAAKSTASYGTGLSSISLHGGTIHYAFGASNTKGNVREQSVARLDEGNDCPLLIDEAYGAGKEAVMDGRTAIVLGCIGELSEIYGGSENADIGNDIELTITSGRFKKVFGGNNKGGVISGSITVNVEETGCRAIEIEQLYGGGNHAAYTTPAGKTGPTVNVKSCKRVDEVYGGGFGEDAMVVGDTHVNISMLKGVLHSNDTDSGNDVEQSIGSVGTVFGGGNAAKVVGSTFVNIGTKTEWEMRSLTTNPASPVKRTVEGVLITDNVYGGGKNADVTGQTNVTVGAD